MRPTRVDIRDPDSRIDRRHVLRTLGVLSVTAMAGCAGDEGEPADDDDDPPEADDEGEDDDAATDDERDEDDEGDEDDQEVVDDEDADDTEEDDEDEGDTSRFEDAIAFADSYAYEGEFTDEQTGQEFRMEGRVAGGDSYMRMDGQDGLMEIYAIEGETFFVEDEQQCFAMPGAEPAEEGPDDVEVGTHEEEVGAHPELEAVGRDEIDGEEVYVFELTAEEATAHDDEVTYYVSVETGYLRRVEADDAVIDFHSWGEVDSIEPPEMECMEMDGEVDDDDLPSLGL